MFRPKKCVVLGLYFPPRPNLVQKDGVWYLFIWGAVEYLLISGARRTSCQSLSKYLFLVLGLHFQPRGHVWLRVCPRPRPWGKPATNHNIFENIKVRTEESVFQAMYRIDVPTWYLLPLVDACIHLVNVVHGIRTYFLPNKLCSQLTNQRKTAHLDFGRL